MLKKIYSFLNKYLVIPYFGKNNLIEMKPGKRQHKMSSQKGDSKDRELKDMNKELLKINEDLKAEILRHQETTEKLVENQQFLDKVLSNAPIVLWSIDLEGKFTFSQGKGLEVLEVKPNERVGKSAIELYQGTTIGEFMQKVIREETTNEIIHYKEWVFDARVSPLFNAEGEKTGYMGIALNISELIETEKALKKFRMVLDQAPEAVFIMDKDSRFEYINPQFTRLSGYTEEDLLQKKILDTLYKGEMPESRKGIINTLRDGNSWEGELLTIRKDGSNYWAKTLASPFKDEQGNFDGYIVFQQDITDQKEMELALRERELFHKTLIEEAFEGVVIAQDFKFVFVNRAFGRMLGYEIDELKEKDPLNIVAPEYQDSLKHFHKPGQESKMNVKNFQVGFIRKDGSKIFGEVNTSIIEINGRPATYLSIRDITERIAFEEALRESEKKYRDLVQNTNSIILKWDKNSRITFLNEYGLKFFGYTNDEIIGRPVIGTIVPPSEEMTGRNLELVMKDIFENPLKYEQNINENMRKNGERVWVSWNNTAVKDENGEIIHIYSVGTDITERRRNEEELRITKEKLQQLNENLEKQVSETAEQLTEANTQLIRLQKEHLQSQFEVLRQQVNPHFLFNSLNVLTSLIKLEPDLAEKFTEHLSKVYRYVLENKDNDLVKMETELEFLDAYIFLINIRFMGKIDVQVEVDPQKREMLVLPLALQLLIENAIKHNTMSKKAPLKIKIFIDENNVLNVVNNLQERESYMASTGVGLKNIEHRYKLLELPLPEFYKTVNEFIAKIPLKVN